MDKTLRAYLAEFVGTFFLVFLTACTVIGSHRGVPEVGLVGMAVAQGCIVAVLLTATCLVSDGCLNPAVVLMFWVTNRYDAQRALIYIGLQLLAAALAGGLLALIFREDQVLLREARVGAPYVKFWRPAGGDSAAPLGAVAAGIAIEAALSFLFVLSVFVTLVDPRRPRIGGLGAGLAQTACVLAGYHLTGAAVNPAVWFGTVLWHAALPGVHHAFADHTVFWIGPIVGAMLASAVYGALLRPAETSTPPPPPTH